MRLSGSARGGPGEEALASYIQWVLRNARAHAADPALRTAAGFAAGGGRAPQVHRAQVGRWESGAVEVTYDLVRRYETVLGLPEAQLLCAIDYFSRQEQRVRATPTLYPHGLPDLTETLELLERALSNDPMTGHDWDRLSGNLGRTPGALIRSGDWEHLIRRCVAEVGSSLHLEFTLRDEAAMRLAGHPRSADVVARIADEALSDPSAQLYSDLAGLIQYANSRAGLAVLVKHLRAPVNDDALWAALFSMTTLLRAGQVPGDVAREAAGLSLEHLRDPGRSFRVQRAAATILRTLDLPGRNRLVFGLTPAARRFAASIILEGRALDREAHAGVSKRVRRALAEDHAMREPVDAVLAGLIATALGESHETSRSNALAILMLSPQGRVVGRAYAAELARAQAADERVPSHECLSVLTWLIQPGDLAVPSDLACSADAEPELAAAAGIVVGNSAEPLGPEHEARDLRLLAAALELARSSTDGPGGADLAALRYRWRGLAYALAMRGRYDLLARVHEAVPGGDAPAGLARATVRWWLDLPEHLRPAAALRSTTPRRGKGRRRPG